MRFMNWLFIGIRIIILCLGLYILALFIWPSIWQPKFESHPNQTATFMDYEPDAYEKQLFSIDNNLPHHRYQRISDSIKHIQNLEKFTNNLHLSGWGLGTIGCFKRYRKDIIVFDSTYSRHNIQHIPDTTYFISLNGYYLREDHSTFRKNDSTFLKYPVITKRDTINHSISGHYEIKPLLMDVRDLPDKIISPYEEKRELLIRVSKSQFTWYLIMMIPIALLILLLFLWGVILQMIRVIEDIANQEAFRKKTYRRLYIIAISLWSNVLIGLIIKYVANFKFSSYIDQAFYLRFSDFFFTNISYIISGFIAFCLAHAFRKGYQLQQEQNLII